MRVSDQRAPFRLPSVPSEEDAWSWITFTQANKRYDISRGVLDGLVATGQVRWFTPHADLLADEAAVRLGAARVSMAGKEAGNLQVGKHLFRFGEVYYSELDLRLMDERARRRQGMVGAWRREETA